MPSVVRRPPSTTISCPEAPLQSSAIPALDDELRLAEQMRIGAAQHPDIEAALETLTKEAGAWRASFAQPLIAAVERGSKGDITTIAATAATDQAPALTGVDALVARIADAETSVAARDDAVTRTRLHLPLQSGSGAEPKLP